jgi:hypothetical protein
MAFAKQISMWGVVSLLLMVVNIVIGEYNFRLEDLGKERMFSRATHYQLCFVFQSAAAICGIIAMRHGSKWWMVLVVPAAWLALGCFFGEV